MSALRAWGVYVGIFIFAVLIDGVGHGQITVGATDDINASASYQIDQVGSGAGFEALPRANPSFIRTVAPKFVVWNFGFMTGDLQFMQLIMVAYFGVLLVISVTAGARALLQRNVGS